MKTEQEGWDPLNPSKGNIDYLRHVRGKPEEKKEEVKQEETKKEEVPLTGARLKPLQKPKMEKPVVSVLDEWESFMADTKKDDVKKGPEDILDQYSD